MLQRVSLFALICASMLAQEFRSTLSGRVTDPSGAAVPGAKVIATESNTGAKSESTTSTEGEYTLPFLNPGPYVLTVDANGFKAHKQSGIQIGTNQKLAVDVKLVVGSQSESVTINSDVELLSTASASVGQVINSSQIASMPMNGRTALTLAQLAYGVTPASDPRFTRPFDNGGPAGFSMGGSQAQTNELLLDGAPDMTRNRRVAYNPPVDAVSEVKVEAFQPDAAYGNTAGGTVNVVMKGGTNDFHGSLYEFNQVSALKATEFFTNAAGQKKAVTRFNQYGLSAGGPIWIPKLVNGKNKLFWFFSYEGIKQSQPEPTFATIPTTAQRTGDFSALAAQGITIYDPATAVLNNGIVSRQPFAGNIIPAGRINAISKNILGYYPTPNFPGTNTGQNNFFSNALRTDTFGSFLGRFDWNVSDKHKLFFNMRNNDRTENRGNVASNELTGNLLGRVNWGAVFDDVYTLSPTFLMNTRLNWNRFIESNTRSSNNFDFSKLGFPAYMKAASAKNVFPRIEFAGVFSNIGDSGGDSTPFDTFQLFQSFTKIRGNHTVKFGADLRKQIESSNSFGNSSGLFSFGNNWTNAASNAASAPLGQDMAAFLLGLPTGGNFQVNATRTNQAYYYAFFVQDDWRVKKNLTLNLGLRYESETGTTERYNRTVSGFDPNATLSVTAAAEANYAASPLALLNGAPYRVRGGINYAGNGNSTIYDPYRYNFSPRFGFSWSPEKLGGKTVIRGGVGVYVGTFGTFGIQQPGFSQQTQLVSAAGGVFLTPIATLSNPFPDGILQPVGNSQGVNTFLGQSVRYVDRKLPNPVTYRWNFNIQRTLGKNLVMELGYIGSDARKIPETRNLNFIPRSFLSTSPTRDQATINRLAAVVANPLRGLLPGTGLNGATISSDNLLRPFPQFSGEGGVSVDSQPNGYSTFHQLLVRVEKRFTNGLQFLANYQWSKMMEATSRLNAADPFLVYQVADEDRPQRFITSGSYDLPFGKNKAFLGSANGLVDRIVGGWQTNVIYTYQSGAPVGWGNVIYFGGDLKWDARGLNGAFDTTRFETTAANQLASNARTFYNRFPSYRAHGVNNVDMSLIKNIPIVEKLKLQFRAEAFNAFNRTQFNGPDLGPTNRNFGKITSAANLPRAYQLALRLTW